VLRRRKDKTQRNNAARSNPRGKEDVMSKIPVNQRFALLAKLGENIDWDSLTSEQVQVGIREARMFAAMEFEDFIRNGFQMKANDFFRETNDLTIEIPALPRPTLDELRARGRFHRIESLYDISPTDKVTLVLGTVFNVDEKSTINSKEFRFRIAAMSNINLGLQQATWLVENQDKFPELMALVEKVYIVDFLGLRVGTDSSDQRIFPLLRHADEYKRWELHWRWLDEPYSWGRRIAVAK
jgi:hypothetical protein